MDDFVGHRLAYFVSGVVSLLIICGVAAAVGYLFDHSGSFGDSVGAGTGMLVGLVAWVALVGWFIVTGAMPELRRRRASRRHAEHVDGGRRRRST